MNQPMDVYLGCYLWDLVHEDMDLALDRIQGETGVSGITVPCIAAPILQLRASGHIEPRVFESKGGAQFQPDTRHFGATRIKPTVADWLRKSDPIRKLPEACHARGLKLRIEAPMAYQPTVVAKHQRDTTRNIFGMHSEGWLCPNNPDVVEYCRGLIESVASLEGVEALVLSHACFGWWNGPNPPASMQLPFEMDAVARELMRLCFCESCQQRAKRDAFNIEAAARITLEELERSVAQPSTSARSFEQLTEQQEPLADFIAWRRTRRDEFIETIVAASKQPKKILLNPVESPSATLAAVFELHEASKSIVEQCLRQVDHAHKQPSQIELSIPAFAGHCRAADQLVATLHQAAEAGLPSVTLQNYGMLPESRLEWVHQAVRFARRQR